MTASAPALVYNDCVVVDDDIYTSDVTTKLSSQEVSASPAHNAANEVHEPVYGGSARRLETKFDSTSLFATEDAYSRLYPSYRVSLPGAMGSARHAREHFCSYYQRESDLTVDQVVLTYVSGSAVSVILAEISALAIGLATGGCEQFGLVAPARALPSPTHFYCRPETGLTVLAPPFDSRSISGGGRAEGYDIDFEEDDPVISYQAMNDLAQVLPPAGINWSSSLLSEPQSPNLFNTQYEMEVDPED